MFVFRTKFRWEETGCASAVSPSSCDSEIVISDFEMGKRECFRRNINARNQKSSPHPPPTPARKKIKLIPLPKDVGGIVIPRRGGGKWRRAISSELPFPLPRPDF